MPGIATDAVYFVVKYRTTVDRPRLTVTLVGKERKDSRRKKKGDLVV